MMPDICDDSPEPFTDSPTTEWCSDGADVDILLATDQWPNETFWALSDLNSNEVIVGGSLDGFERDATHEGNFCLPLDNDQCYSLVIFDQAGDGIDVDGDDPDYCISVNGEELECEINFTRNMETVVFPEDSCSKSCKPKTYRLKGRTPSSPVATVIGIVDALSGNAVTINVFDLSDVVDKEFDYPIDLCAGCYFLIVNEIDGTMFTLYDDAENSVFTEESDTGFMNFCVDSDSEGTPSPTSSPTVSLSVVPSTSSPTSSPTVGLSGVPSTPSPTSSPTVSLSGVPSTPSPTKAPVPDSTPISRTRAPAFTVCSGSEATFEVDIKFDGYSHDISWILSSVSTGSLVKMKGYESSETSDFYSKCVPKGRYKFELFDSYGDGFSDPSGRVIVSYNVEGEGKVEFRANGDFGSSVEFVFGKYDDEDTE